MTMMSSSSFSNDFTSNLSTSPPGGAHHHHAFESQNNNNNNKELPERMSFLPTVTETGVTPPLPLSHKEEEGEEIVDAGEFSDSTLDSETMNEFSSSLSAAWDPIFLLGDNDDENDNAGGSENDDSQMEQETAQQKKKTSDIILPQDTSVTKSFVNMSLVDEERNPAPRIRGCTTTSTTSQPASLFLQEPGNDVVLMLSSRIQEVTHRRCRQPGQVQVQEQHCIETDSTRKRRRRDSMESILTNTTWSSSSSSTTTTTTRRMVRCKAFETGLDELDHLSSGTSSSSLSSSLSNSSASSLAASSSNRQHHRQPFVCIVQGGPNTFLM